MGETAINPQIDAWLHLYAATGEEAETLRTDLEAQLAAGTITQEELETRLAAEIEHIYQDLVVGWESGTVILEKLFPGAPGEINLTGAAAHIAIGEILESIFGELLSNEAITAEFQDLLSKYIPQEYHHYLWSVFSSHYPDAPLPDGVSAEVNWGDLSEETVINLNQLGGYLKTITLMLLVARRIVNEILGGTVDELAKNIQQRFAEGKNAADVAEQIRENMVEAQEKMKKMGVWGKVIAAIGIAVSALISAAMIVGSLGMAAPLAIAINIAVTTALISISVADMASNGAIMSKGLGKAMQAFVKCIQKACGENMPDWAATLVATLVIIAIAVVLIAITRGGGTSLGATLGTKAASSAATEAAKQAVIQASITSVDMAAASFCSMVVIQAVASSNVIFDLVKEIAIASGAPEEEALIWAAVISAICLVVISGAAMGGIGHRFRDMLRGGPKDFLKAIVLPKMPAGGVEGAMLTRFPKLIHAIKGATLLALGGQAATVPAHVMKACYAFQLKLNTEKTGELQALLEIIKEFVLQILGIDKDSLQATEEKLGELATAIYTAVMSVLESVEDIVQTQFQA